MLNRRINTVFPPFFGWSRLLPATNIEFEVFIFKLNIFQTWCFILQLTSFGAIKHIFILPSFKQDSFLRRERGWNVLYLFTWIFSSNREFTGFFFRRRNKLSSRLVAPSTGQHTATQFHYKFFFLFSLLQETEAVLYSPADFSKSVETKRDIF